VKQKVEGWIRFCLFEF